MGFFIALLSIVTFSVVLFFVLLLIVPFNGVVTRYRILYNPKGLNLADEQGGQDNVVGPKVTGVISMFLRVRRIEGWIGLYKGFMPIFIYSTFSTIFSMILVGATTKKPKGSYSIPEGSAVNSFIYGVILSVLSVPFVVLTNRAITTPHKLNTFALRQSLRMLLTSHERRRPWVLWLSPGVLAGQISHLFFISVVSRLVRQLFVPALAGGLNDETDPETVSAIGLSAFILFQALFGTAVLCPLEVIVSRCSVQRNYAPGSEYEDEDAQALGQQNPGSPGVAGEEVEYAGKDEDVLNLRSDSGEEPYRGLRHAYQRILEEEGASALYRAWWLTMIGCVLAGLA